MLQSVFYYVIYVIILLLVEIARIDRVFIKEILKANQSKIGEKKLNSMNLEF